MEKISLLFLAHQALRSYSRAVVVIVVIAMIQLSIKTPPQCMRRLVVTLELLICLMLMH